jgi:hypothetical protein
MDTVGPRHLLVEDHLMEEEENWKEIGDQKENQQQI